MLTFFRRIRKGLLSEGTTSKYLLYAVGEILLVMIGILLALQVNNWNEWRKDRETEENVLENLRKNLELNISQVDNRLDAIDRSNQSGDIVLSVITDKEIDSDTIGRHWRRALLNRANLSLSATGYESLKNLGFDIIRNESLREKIVTLYEETYLNLNIRQRWRNTVRPDWDKYMILHFKKDKEGNSIPRNFDFVINDNYFNGLINLARDQRGFYNHHYRASLEETQRVLNLIKNELGESDP